MLATGIQGEKKEQVTQENTALTMKSGALKVYATPAMIALMEQAAYTSVAGELEEGQGTVGTLMNVSHISATPVGMEVTAKSELVKVDGRKLVSMWKRMMNVEKLAKASMSVLSSTMKNSRTRQITNKESK